MSERMMDFFPLTVREIEDLTPSFRRFTFTGETATQFADTGWDQRIKVVFPTATLGLDRMPTGDDWYAEWRDLPETERLPFRTYTTRAVTQPDRDVVIDMVSHGVLGPASDWIERAAIGNEVLVLGPTRAAIGKHYGIDFVPPPRVGKYLLVGDETAAPAIAVILEQLPSDASGVVVLEVPDVNDIAYLPHHPGFDIRVGSRQGLERNEFLVSESTHAATELAQPGVGSEVEEVDVDTDIIWDVPQRRKSDKPLSAAPVYAWIAGEAGAIKTLRRFLVTEHGIDRRAVAFMGYWRLGRAEN